MAMVKAGLKKVRIISCSAILAIVISSTSSMTLAGGGGGGVVINATVQLFTTFIISQYIMTALTGTNLNYDPVGSEVTQIKSQYANHILNNPSSIWTVTTVTPQVRLLIAQYYYYLVFRYAALTQVTNILLPGIQTHPHGITNQVASVALQGFVATSNQIEKQKQEYERLRKTYLLLALVIMQNPYSPNFLLEPGALGTIDSTYAPEVFLAKAVTAILLQNRFEAFINMLVQEQNRQAKNQRERAESSSAIATMIMSLIVVSRILEINRMVYRH